VSQPVSIIVSETVVPATATATFQSRSVTIVTAIEAASRRNAAVRAAGAALSRTRMPSRNRSPSG
jgi:hypothetical protein